MKISKYIVQREIGNNEILVYSTRTGNTVKLPKNDYLQIKKNIFSNLPSELLVILKKFKIIVAKNENEFNETINLFKYFRSSKKLLDLSLTSSAQCQMGCDYCGQIHQDKKDYSEIDIINIVKRVKKQIDTNKELKVISITWFGSEPLIGLKSLKIISRKIIKLCDDNNLEYSSNIITNGLLLTPRVYKELIELKVTSFQITIDGLEHDKRRFMKNTQNPTFKRIYKNLINITKSSDYINNPAHINLRYNIDTRNSSDIYAFLEKIKNDNLYDKVTVDIQPIHSWANDAHKKSLEKTEFGILETEILSYLLDNGFKMQNDNILARPLTTTCMATNPMYELIDTNGDIFNCTEMPFVPKLQKYKIGSLNDDKNVTNSTRKFNNWYELLETKESKSPCPDCNLLPICGGGCPKHWLDGINACPSYKYNIEDRLLLSYLHSNITKE